MGQQPNIELRIEDLPRPVPEPAAPRRWAPGRPGELDGPDKVPWGGMYGRPGPDTGYALKLVSARSPQLRRGERRADVDAGLAAVAAARASRLGRAPTGQDVDVAMLVLGFDPDGIPGALINHLAEGRTRWFANLAHRPAKADRLVAAVSVEILESSPEEIRDRMRRGERLVDYR